MAIIQRQKTIVAFSGICDFTQGSSCRGRFVKLQHFYCCFFLSLNCMNNASCVGGTVWTHHITETSPGDTETQQTTTMNKRNIKRAALMKRMMHETFFLPSYKSLFKGQGQNSGRNAPKFLQSPDQSVHPGKMHVVMQRWTIRWSGAVYRSESN